MTQEQRHRQTALDLVERIVGGMRASARDAELHEQLDAELLRAAPGLRRGTYEDAHGALRLAVHFKRAQLDEGFRQLATRQAILRRV
jgi:hypothetical protein